MSINRKQYHPLILKLILVIKILFSKKFEVTLYKRGNKSKYKYNARQKQQTITRW